MCCLMTSENFRCHDISRHRWGGSAGWESCCFGPSEGTGPVTVVASGIVWTNCTRAGCYWTRVGCTSGRWGLRAVRTPLGQKIPPLVEQANSRRDSNRDRRRVIASRPSAQTAGRSRWGGPVTGAPDRAARTPDSFPRGPVSTALTLTGPTSVRPAGIVEILRFLPGVWRRYAFNVSTMDTSDLPRPARPLPFGASSPTGQSTCPGAQLSSLRVRPRRRHGAQRPSSRRRRRNSNNERGLRPANRSEPPSQSSSGKDLSGDQAFLASSMRARNLASCSLMASGSLSPNCL